MIEYIYGIVVEVTNRGVLLDVKRHGGQPLGKSVQAQVLLDIQNTGLQIGDTIGVQIVKYGHLNHRQDLAEQLESDFREYDQSDPHAELAHRLYHEP